MFRRFSTDFAIVSILIDASLIAIMLAISTFIRPSLSALPFVAEIPRPFQIPLLLYLIFPVLWVLILLSFSVYDGRKNLRVGDEITNITLGSALSLIALAGTLYLSFRDVSRVLFVVFATLAYLSLIAWRLVYRLAFRWEILRSVQTRKVLIVGAGAVGRELEVHVHDYHQLGLRLVGFLDDNPKKIQSANVLGSLKDAREIVQQTKADDVVLALPLRAYNEVNQLVAELHDLPVKVWIIPDYFSLALHRATVEEFAGLPMLDLRAPALTESQRLTKRAFDITITILTLIPALPLMALIAILIRLDSPGPVLLRQKRAGENGKLFNMLKFRTMVSNAEELRHLVEFQDDQGELIHKIPDDPRVTRIGKIMRRMSFDELPQLFNVMKGEMSLVGPRPELPYLVERYKPWQRKRFAVPQGMTGWWQVNGRSNKPMHLHSEDDLYYVQHYSLWLDLQILLRTILVVLRGMGAY